MVKSWQKVVDMTDELPEEVQRWTAKRRSALIVSIIRGETSVQKAARRHGLTVAKVEDWREKLLSAAENALRPRPRGRGLRKKPASPLFETTVSARNSSPPTLPSRTA